MYNLVTLNKLQVEGNMTYRKHNLLFLFVNFASPEYFINFFIKNT
jgi:hypothetical protein